MQVQPAVAPQPAGNMMSSIAHTLVPPPYKQEVPHPPRAAQHQHHERAGHGGQGVLPSHILDTQLSESLVRGCGGNGKIAWYIAMQSWWILEVV